MRLFLVDKNSDLVREWTKSFKPFTEVQVCFGDILEYAENTIVSPANGYGIMDGGIDLQYTKYFGVVVQDRLQEMIQHRQEGFLPLGAALLVRTGHANIPWMIAAPTMLVPEAVRSLNAFYAMAAVLQCAYRNRRVVERVYCPGLGTGIGQIPPVDAAKEMAHAYRKFRESLNNTSSFNTHTR